VRLLERLYDVYFILPRLTSHWDNPRVHGPWVELLGQNVLRLEDPAGICEMIAGVIGVAEGVLDPSRVEADLREAGSARGVAEAVGKALGPVGDRRRGTRPSTPPGSGAGGGLARF
jgi:hypothetical protein